MGHADVFPTPHEGFRVRVRGNTPLTLLNWTFSDFLPIVCRIFSDVKCLWRAHRAETEQKSSSQSGTEQKPSRNQGSQSGTEQKPSRKPGDQSGTEQNFLSQSYFKRRENKHRVEVEGKGGGCAWSLSGWGSPGNSRVGRTHGWRGRAATERGSTAW